MVAATVEAIDNPSHGTRFLTVPEIRQAGRGLADFLALETL
jgi:hypothetical protein